MYFKNIENVFKGQIILIETFSIVIFIVTELFSPSYKEYADDSEKQITAP